MFPDECCFSCKYFLQEYHGKKDSPCSPGQCRRKPPVVLPQSRGKGHAWSWFPFVKPEWVCGEFERRVRA